jgi:hypothetical protein
MDDCYCNVCAFGWHHAIESRNLFVSLLTQVYVFQTLKLQVSFYICYWEQMWLIPIGFYWETTGLWKVKCRAHFNLHYYFLHSVSPAGSPCLVMGFPKILKLVSPSPQPLVILTLEATSRLSSLPGGRETRLRNQRLNLVWVSASPPL